MLIALSYKKYKIKNEIYVMYLLLVWFFARKINLAETVCLLLHIFLKFLLFFLFNINGLNPFQLKNTYL